jgi:hypothetical protein
MKCGFSSLTTTAASSQQPHIITYHHHVINPLHRGNLPGNLHTKLGNLGNTGVLPGIAPALIIKLPERA